MKKSGIRRLASVMALLLCLQACGAKPVEKESPSEGKPAETQAAAPAAESAAVPEATAAPTPVPAAFYCGTWGVKMLHDGKNGVLLEDAIAAGADPALRDVRLVFQDGGKCQLANTVGAWTVTDTGVLCGSAAMSLAGNYLVSPLNEKIMLVYEKISNSQEFAAAPAEEIAEEAADAAEVTQEPEKAVPAGGIRPEFKAAMDAYEAFYDEYCAFMQKYKQNPMDLSLLSEYSSMLAKVAEMDEKFNAWDQNDMSDEELKYYLDVLTRVEKKMIDLF